MVGMNRDGVMKTNGVFPLWGRQPPSALAAYLPHYNTFVICTTFIIWNPSCIYIPNVSSIHLYRLNLIYVAKQTKGDKSYIIPHDLGWYQHPNDHTQQEACGGTTCPGFYLRGVVLYQGQIMVTGIGGLNPPPKDPVTGKRTVFSQSIQPSKAWTYMDFKDNKIKWGNDLPFGRHHHCVVKYNESTAFVFGGGDVGGEHGQGYILRNYRHKYAIVKDLHSGFFMRFLDPNDPQRYVIQKVKQYHNLLWCFLSCCFIPDA